MSDIGEQGKLHVTDDKFSQMERSELKISLLREGDHHGCMSSSAKKLEYIVACQAHPALVKRSGVRIVFISLLVGISGRLTDRVSSRLRGLAVRWRPRPPGT